MPQAWVDVVAGTSGKCRTLYHGRVKGAVFEGQTEVFFGNDISHTYNRRYIYLPDQLGISLENGKTLPGNPPEYDDCVHIIDDATFKVIVVYTLPYTYLFLIQ